MKNIALSLIFGLLSLAANAAPTITASQSTVTSGTSHFVNIPAGPAGELILVISAGNYTAPPYALSAPRGSGFGTGSPNYCNHSFGFFLKVSNGSETSVTLTSTGPVALTHQVLRISGYTLANIQYAAANCHLLPSTLSDPPVASLGAVYDALFIAVSTYNGAAPSLAPTGYGFGLDAGGTPNLSLSFKSAIASSEDAGPYSLPAAVKSTAVIIVFR